MVRQRHGSERRAEFRAELFTVPVRELAAKWGYAPKYIYNLRSKHRDSQTEEPASPSPEMKSADVLELVSDLDAAEILSCRETDLPALVRLFHFAPIEGRWNVKHIRYIELLRRFSRDPGLMPDVLKAHQELFGHIAQGKIRRILKP